MTQVTFSIAGIDLPLTEAKVKNRTDGRTWHYFGTTKSAPSFGQTIPALDTKLPTSVTVDGVEVTLTHGLTAASYKDRSTGQTVTVPDDKRRPRASGMKATKLPSLGDEERNVSVAISVTKDDQWNVKVTINRVGDSSVSPEERKKRAQETAAKNLAAIQALLNNAA